MTCVFAEWSAGKLRQKATAAKTARGEMARWMAETNVQTKEALCGFDRRGYAFSEAASDAHTFVFERKTGHS